MQSEKKDTSPMVKARRIKRQIRIQEINTPPSTLFDATVIYASDDLPEWFAGLQAIVEDETFTSMDINLGTDQEPSKVRYHLSIEEKESNDDQPT